MNPNTSEFARYYSVERDYYEELRYEDATRRQELLVVFLLLVPVLFIAGRALGRVCSSGGRGRPSASVFAFLLGVAGSFMLSVPAALLTQMWMILSGSLIGGLIASEFAGRRTAARSFAFAGAWVVLAVVVAIPVADLPSRKAGALHLFTAFGIVYGFILIVRGFASLAQSPLAEEAAARAFSNRRRRGPLRVGPSYRCPYCGHEIAYHPAEAGEEHKCPQCRLTSDAPPSEDL